MKKVLKNDVFNIERVQFIKEIKGNYSEKASGSDTRNDKYAENRRDKCIDPSIEFTAQSLQQLKYKVPIVNSISRLEQSRIIFVLCPSNKIAIDSATTLYNDLSKKNSYLKCRIFSPSGEEETTIGETFQSLFLNKKCKIGKGNNTFLIIDDPKTTLIDSFLYVTHAKLDTFVGKYQKNKNYVVVLVSKTSQIDQLKSRKHEGLTLFIPDYLSILLSYHKVKESKFTLLEQKSLGLWGETEQEFYLSITSALKEGVDSFQEKIEQRLDYKVGQSMSDFFTKISNYDSPEQIINSSPLAVYVAYVVTYFPNLGLNSLENLISILLKDEPEILVTHRRLNNVGESVEVEEMRDLLSIWNHTFEGGDKILSLVNVKFFDDEDSREFYSFSDSFLVNSFKSYFKRNRRRFLQKSFKKIMDSGIFFDPLTNGKLLEHLVALSLDMMIRNPEVFGLNVLLSTLYQTHYLENQLENRCTTTTLLLKNFNKKHVLDRICLILTEMLKSPGLNPLVDQLLARQIISEQYEILFDLIKRLQHLSDFNHFYWLRKLIDQGRGKEQKDAYEYLVSQALAKPEQLQFHLKILSHWTPEDESNNLSPSNCASLTFLIDFIFKSPLPKQIKGDRENKNHPLDIKLIDGNLDGETAKILSFLFYPQLLDSVNGIRSIFNQGKLKFEDLYRDILEYWYLILKNPIEGGKTNEIYDKLLLEFKKNLTLDQIQAIYKSFENRKNQIKTYLNLLRVHAPMGQLKSEERLEVLKSGEFLYRDVNYIYKRLHSLPIKNI